MHTIKLLLLLFPLFLFQGNKPLSSTDKHTEICLVWGLLKYHHPDVSRGKYDWDASLLTLLQTTQETQTQEVLNQQLLAYIQQYELPTTKFKLGTTNNTHFRKNVDYAWIEQLGFSDELIQELHQIKDNQSIGDYYASHPKLVKIIQFPNEQGIEHFNREIAHHRLLTLFSFWNLIHYWDVNKYLTETPWRQTLTQLIPTFLAAHSEYDYEIAKLNMLARLNDSHSFQTSTYMYEKMFNHAPAFGVKIINDTLLVNSIYHDELATKDHIQLGDLITHINGLSVKTYIQKQFAPILSVSNTTYLYERASRLILRNNIDSLSVRILHKDGTSEDKTIHLYQTFKYHGVSFLERGVTAKWKEIATGITYINLGTITSKDLAQAFEESSDQKAIILDLRNYPKKLLLNDFTPLFPKKTEFIKLLAPLKNRPSVGEYDAESPLRVIDAPFKVGKKNAKYFKGKVVLLVNRTTGSQAEFFGMAIQQAPQCITIGEQTMGAVMNITSALLPDKQEFYFTSNAAFYPDGTLVQGKGLQLDYEIQESALNYQPDLYLQTALSILQEQ